MDYKVIRSGRRTLALQIKNGEVIVRAPNRTSDERIERFVTSHLVWIYKQLARYEERNKNLHEEQPFSEAEMEEIMKRAKQIIPERVAYYASIMGVDYGEIRIKCQKTRWGSCSSDGNLNFNCLLVLAPPRTLDSVVVHELCHRKEMNHSRRFYKRVLDVMPDYYAHHEWLKQNGDALQRRVGR